MAGVAPGGDGAAVTVRPIEGFVLLVDDQPEYVERGVVVRKGDGCDHLDFVVAACGSAGAGFGAGDRVVLSGPDVGRRVMLDGVVYRVVRASDVVARTELREDAT